GISPTALPLTNGSNAAEMFPYQFAVTRVLPYPQFGTAPAEDLLTSASEPVQERVVGEDRLPVAHPHHDDEDRARLEGCAKARFALAQSRLAGPKSGFRFL